MVWEKFRVEAVNFVYFRNSFLARPYADNRTHKQISLLRGFPAVIAGHELISLTDHQSNIIYFAQFVSGICYHLSCRPYYSEHDRKLFVKYCFILLNHFVEQLSFKDDLYAVRQNKSRFLGCYGKFTNSIRLLNYIEDITSVIANELGLNSRDSIQSIARIMGSNRVLMCEPFPSWSFEQSVNFINKNKEILIAFEDEDVPYLANYELAWQYYDKFQLREDRISSEQLRNQIYLSKTDEEILTTIDSKGDCERLVIKTWCIVNYLNESKPWEFLLNLAKYKNLEKIDGVETSNYIKVVITLCFLESFIDETSTWSIDTDLKLNALIWTLLKINIENNLPKPCIFMELIKNKAIMPKWYDNSLKGYLEPLLGEKYNSINSLFTSILESETKVIPTKYFKEGIWDSFCSDLNVTSFHDKILFVRYENK